MRLTITKEIPIERNQSDWIEVIALPTEMKKIPFFLKRTENSSISSILLEAFSIQNPEENIFNEIENST